MFTLEERCALAANQSVDVVVSVLRQSEITDFVELLDISQTTTH